MKKKILILILLLSAAGGVFGWYKVRDMISVPETRLSEGSYYPGMEPDFHCRYITLPIDHRNPSIFISTEYQMISPDESGLSGH